MLDVLARRERDVDGIELHDLAGSGGLGVPGQTLGEAAFCGPFLRLGGLAHGGHGQNRSTRDEMGENAPHGCLRHGEPLLAQLDDDLGLAPGRLLEAPLLDGLHELGGPGRLARCLGPAGLGGSVLGPAVEGGERRAHGLGGLACGEPVAAGLAPARDRVSSLHYVAALLRCETRRQTGTAIYRAVQTTESALGISGVLRLPDPSLGDLQFALNQGFSYVADRGQAPPLRTMTLEPRASCVKWELGIPQFGEL